MRIPKDRIPISSSQVHRPSERNPPKKEIAVDFNFSSQHVFQIALKAYSTDPKQFVLELVNDAISKLSDKNLTKEEKEIFIEEFFW